MLKEMLNNLEKLSDAKVDSQLKGLVYGIEPKAYLPLMKRQKCGMLQSTESKWDNFMPLIKIKIYEICRKLGGAHRTFCKT